MNTPTPKLNLSEQPWTECECGGKMFEGAVVAKRISPILSSTGKEEIYPIEILFCKSCNLVPAVVHSKIPSFPEELKAKKKTIIQP